MSRREICWRVGAEVQASLDLCALALRQRPVDISRITRSEGPSTWSRPRAIGVHLSEDEMPEGLSSSFALWRDAVIERADRLLENRMGIFDLEDVELGPEVKWNYEYAVGREAPMGFAPRIDYRDHAVTGDAKIVWEPNRHQHLVVLARAYRLSGDRRYADKVLEQIESWIRQCPYGRGMNWRSPLELAIRLINWVWALELISPSGVLSSEHLRRVLPVVHRHMWEISRKYSRFSSANNHLVGEAAGVFIGSSYFKGLKGTASWNRQSREILMREIARQTLGDGGHCELAMGYHLFVLEFFLLAGLVARNTDQDFPVEYWERLESLFGFVGAFAEGGDTLPMFGDCDDGYVLDLGEGSDGARGLLAVGAALFGRGDLKAVSKEFGEPAFWLLGGAGHEAFSGIDGGRTADLIESRAFAETGCYLLQAGHRDGPDRISVSFDCADLGFGSIAAHGHADALSFTLRAFGVDVLVDPGTYDYFTHPRWRSYFRSTRGHNTIVIDGRDQSEMLGLFLWGGRADARCIAWNPTPEGGTVVGEHDGYGSLDDPVSHRRAITLDSGKSEVIVRDDLHGATEHDAAMYLHFAEHCRVEEIGGNTYEVDCGPGAVVVRVDPSLAVSVYRGSEEPILGWVSRGYHCKEPSTTLVGRRRWTGSVELETRIIVGETSLKRPLT